jgi:uncharacterized protein
MIQILKPTVDNWLRTRQSVSDATHAFSVFVLHTNLGLTLEGGINDDVYKRVELMQRMRDNRGTFVIDKESEEFSNVSMSLGTLDHLQAQAQEHICAASRIPLVKYTGLSPSGLNATAEPEVRVYYDMIHATQEYLLRKPITTVTDLMQIELFGDVDPDITRTSCRSTR